MSKPTFAKLGLIKNTEVKILQFNNQDIEIKQYLPIDEKLELIGNAINNVLLTDENKFPNNIKLDMYVQLEIVFKYTNLSFTEKQKEDLPKLYDLIAGSDFLIAVLGVIPDGDYEYLLNGAKEILHYLYEYNNSIYGVLNNVSRDYQNLDLDIEALRQKLADADNLDIVKDVVTKLG